jgi:hypothetical protein
MTLSNRIRSYTEMLQFLTFKDRYEYLRLRASVGESTFGFDRWINQQFYRSTEWKRTRDIVIIRDHGMDLGVDGYQIFDKIFVHHMNPMRLEDLDEGDPDIFDPEYLISVTLDTHNAIHYGDESLLPEPFVERRPGDTRLW